MNVQELFWPFNVLLLGVALYGVVRLSLKNQITLRLWQKMGVGADKPTPYNRTDTLLAAVIAVLACLELILFSSDRLGL